MREQMPPAGRVLICDMVMPEDSAQSRAKVLDIEMLVMTPGGQRKDGRRVSYSVGERRFAALPHRRDSPADMRY
jgi:hypothetical protein